MEKNGIYTMEQFKEIYDKAVVKVIEKMSQKFHDAEGYCEPMQEFAFSLHNMVAFQELKAEIFTDEESE